MLKRLAFVLIISLLIVIAVIPLFLFAAMIGGIVDISKYIVKGYNNELTEKMLDYLICLPFNVAEKITGIES